MDDKLDELEREMNPTTNPLLNPNAPVCRILITDTQTGKQYPIPDNQQLLETSRLIMEILDGKV
jgi:hypothetical protein